MDGQRWELIPGAGVCIATTGVQPAGTAVGDTSHCRLARHAFSAALRPSHLRACRRRDRYHGTTEAHRREYTADRRPACPPDGAAVSRRPPPPSHFGPRGGPHNRREVPPPDSRSGGGARGSGTAGGRWPCLRDGGVAPPTADVLGRPLTAYRGEQGTILVSQRPRSAGSPSTSRLVTNGRASCPCVLSETRSGSHTQLRAVLRLSCITVPQSKGFRLFPKHLASAQSLSLLLPTLLHHVSVC